MAIIYGRPEAEMDLLSIAPNSVKKIEDVETIHEELKEKLTKTKKEFFDKVPEKIVEEEKVLETIKNNEKETHQKFDEKIKSLESKKTKGGFATITSSIKIAMVKNISKRREINKIKNLEKKQQEQLTEWKEKPENIFDREKKDQIEEVNTYYELERSKEHTGAKGEVRALKKLSELSDDYHIFCGVRAALPRYITYNGRKNLRSAQMDFVVVSKKGVILIEVKNWSSKFYRESNKISPHEQVDRAGRVLWIALKSWWSPSSPRITNLLLSIQDNMKYDPRFKFVLVTNLEKINYFIENRQEEFSNKDIERIVDRLRNYLPK